MSTNYPSRPSPEVPGFSRGDKQNLARLEKKLQVLRDRTAAVAKGYQSGCIVTGRGGTSKSFTVLSELERLSSPYRLANSHITPRGLFDLLQECPESIHVIEDAEAVTRNPTSLGVLRSALWGNRRDREGRTERLITWATHRSSLEVFFSGGIILVTNRPLSQLPEVQALATRVPCLDIHVSDREIAALMRQIASRGYRRGGGFELDAAECLEVADFIIAESARLNRALDLRLVMNAFADRIQADDHDAGCTWQDLVYSTLCGRPSVVGEIEPVGIRQQNRERELEVARQIVALDAKNRLEIWKKETGKGRATMYRRLAELGRVDSMDFEK